MHEERREVTLREASQLSGLSDKTLRRMIADQRVRFSQDSRGRYRIALDDLPAREVDPLAELRSHVEQLERRLARLERAERVERPTPSFTYVPPVTLPESAYSASGGDSDVSRWGARRKARWIAEHSDYAESSARDWPELRSAASEDDLRAAIDTHLRRNPPQGRG